MQTVKTTVPSGEVIGRALGAFQLSANKGQVLQIQQYMGVLLAWNAKINLTAIRDPLEILHRHFCESMFGVKTLPAGACRLADVGSGGGFPGLPLKILRPDLELFLIESNVKKATFLAEVVRELGLTGTKVLVSRYEDLGEEVAPLRVICTRAVGDYELFLKWAASPMIAAEEVVLWVGGRDLDMVREMAGWTWREPMTIPQSLRRYLLVGERKP